MYKKYDTSKPDIQHLRIYTPARGQILDVSTYLGVSNDYTIIFIQSVISGNHLNFTKITISNQCYTQPRHKEHMCTRAHTSARNYETNFRAELFPGIRQTRASEYKRIQFTTKSVSLLLLLPASAYIYIYSTYITRGPAIRHIPRV